MVKKERTQYYSYIGKSYYSFYGRFICPQDFKGLRIFFVLIIQSIIISSVLANLAFAQSPDMTPKNIAASENFRLECPDDLEICEKKENLKKQGDTILEEMEMIKHWFASLDFPERGKLLKDESTDQEILLVDVRPVEKVCEFSDAVACHREKHAHSSRILLPLANISSFKGSDSTLAHEYFHSRQYIRDNPKAKWFHEALATAIGTAWVKKRYHYNDLYPPDLNLSLDLPFHYDDMRKEAKAYAGYRNWAYLLYLGKQLGSQDEVAYLRKEDFLNEMKFIGESENSADIMQLFYRTSLVGSHTFNKSYPEFISQFNNLEKYNDGGYYYYNEADTETFRIPHTREVVEKTYQKEVVPYGVSPVLLKLEVGEGGADSDPKDRLMLVEVAIDADYAPEDLTLVVEHVLGETQHKKSWLIDGNTPPSELGFYRTVLAPQAFTDQTENRDYTLKVKASPVSIAIPACLQQNEPNLIEIEGLDPEVVINWRIVTDNGKVVNGNEVIPTKSGEITLTLEVDSPITRSKGSLAPRQHPSSKIDLGTYQVHAQECMIRMIPRGNTEESVWTYNADGEYTEIKASDSVIYISASDVVVISEGQRINLPPQAKSMFLNSVNIPLPLIFTGKIKTKNRIHSHGPLVFSEVFTVENQKKAPYSKTLTQKPIACPQGEGDQCILSSFTIQNTLINITSPHHQDKPLRVEIIPGVGGTLILDFEYGNFPIGRPTGW